MLIRGVNLIGGGETCDGQLSFRARDPSTGAWLDPAFAEATTEEIAASARAAERAFESYAALTADVKANFLRAVADELISAGEALVARASLETGLPRQRLEAEHGRTVSQLRLFGEVVGEGSWVDARIDRAIAGRQPARRPDVRRLLVPLGPVAVFGSSNFPLAFSVAGGDTASALAAGCPVVVKAHPAHPGTSEIAGRAIVGAARRVGIPDGVFSLVHGPSPATGHALVSQPEIQAVAFTGSFQGGRALLETASRRPQPIPVFAEMGSVNPVFVLPDALVTRGDAIADALAASVTLGSGQFCTNPGVTVLVWSDAAERFIRRLGIVLSGTPAGTMVHAGIKEAYVAGVAAIAAEAGVTLVARSNARGPCSLTDVQAVLLHTDAPNWIASPRLAREIYGPATLAIQCGTAGELLAAARALPGHLVATIHGTERDLADYDELLMILRRKAGRIVVNGFPTGVEVCHAMQHGGPWPATTDARATSVGTAAISRFARPVCFQDAPSSVLPSELRDENPRGIWRLIDGRLTKG